MPHHHSTPAGGEPAASLSRLDPAADTRWKALTAEANRAFASGDLPAARSTYAQALDEADRLMREAIERPDGEALAPVVYNISCHNLAELEAQAGRTEQVEAYYRRAFDRLLAAADSPASPLGIRIACVQHLKHALALLVRHLRAEGGAESLVETIVRQAQDTAFAVFRVARHDETADCPHCPLTFS